MTMLLSDKQESFILDSDAFLNIADGAVRSGKTFSAIYRFAEAAITKPPGDMMLLGKSERTIRRNVIYPMQEVFGRRARYVQGMGELHFAGRRIYVAGATNEGAEARIRGVTLIGAYCNEITLYPEVIVNTLIDRCSLDGAQIFADCNPDNPQHWLYKNYLTNKDVLGSEVKRWQFRLDDNPALSDDYKDRIAKLHSGIWYRRMVLGEWTVASGAIYDQFDPDLHVVKELPDGIRPAIVGIDYGTSNATVFILFGWGPDGVLYAMKEYYHSGSEGGPSKTDGEYSADFKKWLPWPMLLQSIDVDASAKSFRTQLLRDGIRPVRKARNDVIDGIRTVSNALTSGAYKIHESCERLIAEKYGYVWDEAAQQRGEDKPVKLADHTQDAERYALMRAFGNRGLPSIPKPKAA
jgi:PBSX family phage terminase large subunit